MCSLHNSIDNTELEPYEFSIGQNYPNPFREKTVIKYCIAHKTRVKLTVYDAGGVIIQTLVDEEKYPGTYEVEFNIAETNLSADRQSRQESRLSGTYFYRLEAGDYKCEKQMELNK